MSKANIIKTEKIGSKVRLTFETTSGPVVYEFSGSSARALNRGTDPSQLAGKRIDQKKTK